MVAMVSLLAIIVWYVGVIRLTPDEDLLIFDQTGFFTWYHTLANVMFVGH